MVSMQSEATSELKKIPADEARTLETTGKQEAQERSRWLTVEFLCHYLMIAQALFFGLRSVHRISSMAHPAYGKYSVFLTSGWIPNRMMDISDPQYGSFRNNLPALSSLMIVYLICSYFIRRAGFDVTFRCLLSITFLFVLHGFNVTKILVIAAVNYLITKKGRDRYRPWLLWTWALLVLIITEWFEFPFIPESMFIGFYKRWNIVFKITVLRMISFGMDYHWFIGSQYSEQKQTHKLSCKSCTAGQDCDKFKTQFGCKDESDFDWPQYLLYLFYPPLYLAGPIITFHSFTYQSKQPNIKWRSNLLYAVRLVGCFLSLDILLQYCYVVAIKDSRSFAGFNATDFGMVGFFNLKIIWLKLLIIWRYFRLVALIDGIDSPENMVRCMSNNYSGMAFWRSWHRSFYLWIVRYLYIPLGGSRSITWNMWPVFMFVAVWHDLRLHLLTWSWLICLFFLPEIIALWLKNRLGMEKWSGYRTIAGIAATGCVCMMMTANLVGFAVGLEGMGVLLRSILTWNGLLFAIDALCTIYSAVQIMFEVRLEERRRGIYNNF